MARRKQTSSGESVRQGFLAEIVKHLEDDTPRLIFADWLDEHGENDRAEFIRLGCRVARLAGDDPQLQNLQEQLAALQSKHSQQWLQEVPAWARKGVSFHRGFMYAIVASAKQWIKGADDLLAAVPLNGLRLEKARDQLPELLAQRSLLRLRYLSLGWNRLEDEGVVALAAAGTLANLWTLELNIVHVGDAGVKALAASSHLAGLTSLNLVENRVGPAGAEALAKTQTLLHLADLDLSENRLGDRGLQALARSRFLAGLHRLNLYGNDIGDQGVLALAASPHARSLRWLALSGNSITDAGAVALATSPHLIGLKWLYLHTNEIATEGALALAASPGLGDIQDLTLDGGTFDPKATEALQRRFGKRVRL
jgi:uncharacterized protein (TIGR02996 family)